MNIDEIFSIIRTDLQVRRHEGDDILNWIRNRPRPPVDNEQIQSPKLKDLLRALKGK